MKNSYASRCSTDEIMEDIKWARPVYISLRRVQHLQPELEFCLWVNANRRLLRLIPFTDEATFTRDWINNTRKSHRWAEENPHATVESNFQHRLSANVWCGIVDTQPIGPVILEHHPTGRSYIEFLRNELPGLLEGSLLHKLFHLLIFFYLI
jgi:hypothetical protein